MPPSLSAVLQFLYSQALVTPPYPTEDFSGKTVIVTGANVGLGFEASRHFARLGASKLILACRNTKAGEEAQASIESSTSCKKGVVEVWPLDLCSYASVKAFAKRASQLDRVDAVVENAGILTREFKIAEEDERTLTTNVTSTFLLALLLLPKLKETAAKYNVRPHLAIVSSEVHGFTTFPERKNFDAQHNYSVFDALNDPAVALMQDRYNVSKLLEVLVLRHVCSPSGPAPPGYPVIINFLNPGLCHSSLSREMGGFAIHIAKKVLARTTELGSRTLVHAAAAGEETHGEYLCDSRIAKTSPLVRSDEGQQLSRKVWEELAVNLERIHPGVTKNF